MTHEDKEFIVATEAGIYSPDGKRVAAKNIYSRTT